MGKALAGKSSIVTGGATGIGRATSLRFAREGASVTVVDRNVPEGETTVEMINREGGSAIFVETDVSNEEQVRSMVESVVDTYGRIDVLVNAAGILIRTMSRLADVSNMEWDLTLNTNLRGVFYCCRSVIPHMLQVGGSIVNVSSGSANSPSARAAPYGISKAGVISLTSTAAREYADEGIRVNAVVPGLIDTPQARGSTGSRERFELRARDTALGRAGRPDEVASLILFLASDESSFATGASYVLDGGGSVGGWVGSRSER